MAEKKKKERSVCFIRTSLMVRLSLKESNKTNSQVSAEKKGAHAIIMLTMSAAFSILQK
jgi:hypothetical protein